MTTRYLTHAFAFLFGGGIILFGLYCLISFGNSMGGAGDGATSGSVASPFFVVILFGCYFGCGIIASFISSHATRKYLSVLAHIFPFFILIIEWRMLLTFFVINLLILTPFGFVWKELLCQPKNKTNINDDEN